MPNNTDWLRELLEEFKYGSQADPGSLVHDVRTIDQAITAITTKYNKKFEEVISTSTTKFNDQIDHNRPGIHIHQQQLKQRWYGGEK